MSVLIPNFNIPNLKGITDGKASMSYSCQIEVPANEDEGQPALIIGNKRYPITDLPIPHGRLIDRDEQIEFLKRIKSIIDKSYVSFDLLMQLLDMSKTVIEAEDKHKAEKYTRAAINFLEFLQRDRAVTCPYCSNDIIANLDSKYNYCPICCNKLRTDVIITKAGEDDE